MKSGKKIYESPVDVPKEIDAYWHNRWAEIMNEKYREKFLEAGLAGHSYTEKAPDMPNGEGAYHFGFRSNDGAFEFRNEEGDAVVEWDTYKMTFQALGDPTYDPTKDIKEGRCRYIKNPEHFGLAVNVIPIFREVLKIAIAETEKKYNVVLPKFW